MTKQTGNQSAASKRVSLCIVVAACFAVAVLGTGCATIVKGTTQRVQINSEPTGATARVGGKTVTTPASVLLKSADLYTVVVSKEGYHTEKVSLEGERAAWYSATS